MKPRFIIIAMLSTMAFATAASADRDRDRGREKDRDHKKPERPPADAPPVAPAFNSTGWTLLGEVAVNGRRDKDTIKVGKYEGRFDQITLVVTDSDLELTKLVIKFGNGEKFAPSVRHTFDENSRTRVIDLPGNDRTINKIELGYKNTRGRGRAFVQVWGRDTRPPEPPYTPPAWEAKGWDSLGVLEVKGKHDHDTLQIGRDDGRFDKLTFVVHDNDLEMYDVLVTFGNGETFKPTTRLVFKEGSRTGVIDLPGEQRYIRKIDFAYGNIGRRGSGNAKVEVFGKAAKYIYTPPSFDSTGWESLGTVKIRGKKDRDVLKIGKDDGRFTKLTFVVHDSDLELYDVKITFGNGETMSPSTRLVFREGSRTGVIDLPGEKRYIKKIEFFYGNLPRSGRAKLEVFGVPGEPDKAKVKVRDHTGDKRKGHKSRNR